MRPVDFFMLACGAVILAGACLVGGRVFVGGILIVAGFVSALVGPLYFALRDDK